MKMLASMATARPVGSVARSCPRLGGEARELLPFGDGLDHVRRKPLKDPRGLLDGPPARDLDDDALMLLQWQGVYRPEDAVFVNRVYRKGDHDISCAQGRGHWAASCSLTGRRVWGWSSRHAHRCSTRAISGKDLPMIE